MYFIKIKYLLTVLRTTIRGLLILGREQGALIMKSALLDFYKDDFKNATLKVIKGFTYIRSCKYRPIQDRLHIIINLINVISVDEKY